MTRNIFSVPFLIFLAFVQCVFGRIITDTRPVVNHVDSEDDRYLLGVGKADITGPAVEVTFMGYANSNQVGTGLRQRIYSRAFIIGQVDDAKSRIVYVVLDIGMGDTAIRNGILEALAAMGGDYAVYNQQNVAITGTHSHSGPGAWLNYLLPQISTKGFDKQSYQAIVDGAVKSIVRAHENLAPGHLSIAETTLNDASINRSPYAYLANPPEERAKYSSSVDKTVTALRFTHSAGNTEIGILTWFAVHGTSMFSNNTLVTGDNKGVASLLFEKSTKNPSFVAGFSQSNVGDTSPNVNGAYCESGPSAGQQCDFQTSLCDGRNEPCHGRGPFFGPNNVGTSSAYEIGKRQFASAYKLWSASSNFTPVRGAIVRGAHRFVDLSGYAFPLPNGTHVRTCSGALGYSFAAGTTDGPGQFDFKQNQTRGDENRFWKLVSGFIHTPSEDQKTCQGAKPILLDVGETKTPYAWSPNIVDVQLLRVGNLWMIISPGEATTMSGRRWRDAIAAAVSGDDTKVVLGGPANSYTHYIATAEEYAVQRYEGASTLYGPWTLDAQVNLSVGLVGFLEGEGGGTPPQGPTPPDNRGKSLSLITGVVLDAAPLGRKFGDVVRDVEGRYGRDASPSVTFVGANPRNNLRLEGTFAVVERLGGDGWEVYRDDSDWALTYIWRRTTGKGVATSEVDLTWEVAEFEEGLPAGETYRFRYFGDAKGIGGKITPFEGVSGRFTIG